MEDNKGTAEVVDRKLRAILSLKDMYPNFTEFEYECAVEIANLDNFENEEREMINGIFGNRLHYKFIIKAFEYLSNRIRIKEYICRS
jgi:hypothetical protein